MKKNNLYLLDELKKLYGIKTLKELGDRFNIPSKTIENWNQKGEIPSRGLSIQYVQLLIDIALKDKKLQKKLEETQNLLVNLERI